MRPSARWWGGAALVVALLTAGAAAGPPLAAPASGSTTIESASVAASGACAGASGVTVVVDFGTTGGGVQTRCAREPVSSGFEALKKAGFTYAGTARFPGLLCRIDGKPSPEQDACDNAPSSTFYWAYWTAPAPGGSWTYSDMGAGNRDPAPGSVEGWAFSDGCKRSPSSPPCPTKAPATTTTAAPATTRPPSATGSPATTAVGSSAPSPAGGAAATSAPPGPGAEVAPDGTAPTTDGAALPGTARSDDTTDDELALSRAQDPADPDTGGGGSPVGLVAGAAVAAALGAGAMVRRRRSHALRSAAE